MSAAESTRVRCTVEICGKPVAITGVEHILDADVAKAVAAVPFVDWVRGMDPALQVHSIHMQSIDFFGPRVGFIKFHARATFHGKPVPGIVFMRGGAVAVLVVLTCEGERWAVCVRQPRIPCGQASFLEIPAGMLDGSGHFSGVAAKELAEETGIVITDEQLIDMTELAYGPTSSVSAAIRGRRHEKGGAAGSSMVATGSLTEAATSEAATAVALAAAVAPGAHRGMYPSVGACDEFLRLMYYAAPVDRSFLEGLQGKAAGCVEEGEQITLDLLPLEDLWAHAPDGKTLSALLLYEKLRAAGKIK